MKNLHEGHRERLRKRFLSEGIGALEYHQILELALFYAVPRRDTNELAHKLLREFGSISAVFDAPESHLKQISGIGENAAAFIKIIPQLAQVYLEDKFKQTKKNFTYEDCVEKLRLKMLGRTKECTAIMLFDAKNRVVFDGIIAHGSFNSVAVYSRKIVELISNYGAVSVMIAHNHPSGIAMPSKNDIESTKIIKKLLNSIGVKLIDHIIVADGDWGSCLV